MSRIIITPGILFYSPFGFILVIIRSLLLIYVFLASVILYTVPPVKRLLLRSMCSLLGFIVTSEGSPSCSREQPIVSNCVTLFDHMALNVLANCVTPYKFMLSWALTWRQLDYDELSSPNVKKKICDVFHLQPEETPTGTLSNVVLQFNSAPFKLFSRVQPVAISVSTYLPINLSVHPIDWRYEIFWALFSPLIRIHVKFLPPISRITEDQTTDEFMEIVRKEIATNLGARLIDMDKNQFCALSRNSFIAQSAEVLPTNKNKEHEKEVSPDYLIEDKHKSEENNSNIDDSIITDPRIGQVLAVLPAANHNTVKELLDQTGDVDTVISYLLEHSDFTETRSSSLQLLAKHVAPSCLKLAASNFSRNPEDRHKSFVDRKVAFLENARQRYLETHPISIIDAGEVSSTG